MTESTRKKVICGVLVVAVIWGYSNLKPDSDSKPAAKRDTKTVVQSPSPAAPAASQKAVAPKLVRVEEKAKEPWGEDPFRVERRTARTSRKANKVLKWTLSGILYNSHSPIAIINRQQVKNGDTVDNARVVKIDKKAVTLEHNGKQMTITVTKG